MRHSDTQQNTPYRLLLAGICLALVAGFSTGDAYAASETLAERFNELDRNRDSLLTPDEIQSRPALVRFTNLYYRDSFRWADANKDGLINFEEFIANEESISAE